MFPTGRRSINCPEILTWNISLHPWSICAYTRRPAGRLYECAKLRLHWHARLFTHHTIAGKQHAPGITRVAVGSCQRPQWRFLITVVSDRSRGGTDNSHLSLTTIPVLYLFIETIFIHQMYISQRSCNVYAHSSSYEITIGEKYRKFIKRSSPIACLIDGGETNISASGSVSIVDQDWLRSRNTMKIQNGKGCSSQFVFV